MRFHKLQNVQIALDFLKHRQVVIHTGPYSMLVSMHVNKRAFIILIIYTGQTGQHQE